MKIVRRLGTPPAQRCNTDIGCPDVFELDDGRFAVIGADATADLDDQLATLQAGRGAGERIVVVPRDVLLAALADATE